MKIFLQLVACFLTAHAATLVNPTVMDWEEYKVEFGKTYKTQQEEQFRMKVFMDTRALIAEHNEKYERGEVTYKMGINKFSDMLSEEYMYPPVKIRKPEMNNKNPKIPRGPLPPEVNWVTKGAVSPVKDQGDCNAGYAFSITGAIESRILMGNHSLVTLSEQQIIDCADVGGCIDNDIYDAYFYAFWNFGIDTEISYPYEGKQGKCRYKNNTLGVQLISYSQLVNPDEEYLAEAVYYFGPISNYMYASPSLHHYHSGVFEDFNCNHFEPNHSVLVVGYGTDNVTKKDYWLVKNSWGTNWGEDGYFRLARNKGNMCHIARTCLYPKIFEYSNSV